MKQKLSVIYENMNYCVAIVATLVFYVLAHGYRSSNLMFSHDSLQTIYQVEWQHKISLGRYLQPLVWFIRGQLTMPWLVDIGAVVLMISSVVMVVRIFEVKKYWMVIFISGIMCTNVAFTFTNAAFIQESDAFMLALFCSLLAVYINNNYKFGFFIGAIPLFISIGLYQAYIQCAIFVFIIQIILKIVDNDNINIKKISIFCAKALCTVFLGSLIYFVCYKIVLLATNIKISTAENSMGSITGYSLNEIVRLIIGAYSSFVGAFVFPESYNPGYILSVVNCLIGLFTFICIFIISIKNNVPKINTIFLFFVLAIMPIGANCIFIVSKGYIHTLLKYSYGFVYILFLEIVNRMLAYETKNKQIVYKKLFTKICVCMLSLLIWGNIVFANQIYLKKSLEDSATLSYMTRLVDRIEQTEGYMVGETKIALIGNLNNSKLSVNRPGFYNLGVGAGCNFSITYEGFEKAYFEQILGYPINLLNVEECNNLAEINDVKKLNSFPSSDCYIWIDDVLVYKIAD